MHTITFVRIFAAAPQLAIDRWFRMGRAVSHGRPEWPACEGCLSAQGWSLERRDYPERRYRAVYEASSTRNRERLAEKRGEHRAEDLCRQRIARFDSESDAKSAAQNVNPANPPSQNCACARIPTRSARCTNEFVFTIRRNPAGLPDHARSPPRVSSTAPHPHARYERSAGPCRAWQ